MTMTMALNADLEEVHTSPRSWASDPSAMWLAARRLNSPARKHWMVAIVLDAAAPRGTSVGAEDNTRLYIEIDSTEWGILFCRGNDSSWIRVSNVPRVHECDDFGLLPYVTDLRDLGAIIRLLERRFHIQFRRQHATIHTDLVDAQQKILLWVLSAL
jgi:hypothetical protein